MSSRRLVPCNLGFRPVSDIQAHFDRVVKQTSDQGYIQACLNECLCWCSVCGNEPSCRYLLSIGAHSLWQFAGLTPLHVGAYSGKSAQVVQTLLSFEDERRRVPVDAPDSLGMTACFWAILYRRDIAVVDVLVEKGANPYKGSPWEFTNRLVGDHYRMMKSGRGGDSSLQKLMNSPDFHELEEAFHRGLISLREASFLKDFLLIWTAGSPKAFDYGTTRLKRCKLLLKLGANPKRRMVIFSAIHSASARGNTEEVDLLVRHGVDVNEEDGASRTPLLLAAVRGHVDCAGYLLRHGANSRHRMPGGTIVELARRWDQRDVVTLMEDWLAREEEKKSRGTVSADQMRWQTKNVSKEPVTNFKTTSSIRSEDDAAADDGNSSYPTNSSVRGYRCENFIVSYGGSVSVNSTLT